MASLIFDHVLDHLLKGDIDFDTDTFKAMLVTSSYTPNKGSHEFRSSVTNEVSGTGYSAGGAVTGATVSLDTSGHKGEVTFDPVTWTAASLTARACVIYKDTGSSATDILIGYSDNGADATVSGADFTFSFTSTFKLQN